MTREEKTIEAFYLAREKFRNSSSLIVSEVRSTKEEFIALYNLRKDSEFLSFKTREEAQKIREFLRDLLLEVSYLNKDEKIRDDYNKNLSLVAFLKKYKNFPLPKYKIIKSKEIDEVIELIKEIVKKRELEYLREENEKLERLRRKS